MKDVLDVRQTFDQNHDILPARMALHPTGHHRVALRVAIPSSSVHDSKSATEDRKPLSEFVVWMMFLAYLAVILTVSYLLRAHFMSG